MKKTGLYGVYGRHEIAGCPLNNIDSAKGLVKAAEGALESLLPKYKINKILGQYHSGLEHTFVWILDAEDPHLIEEFAIEGGMAKFNEVKIVPLMEFKDVVSKAKAAHGL